MRTFFLPARQSFSARRPCLAASTAFSVLLAFALFALETDMPIVSSAEGSKHSIETTHIHIAYDATARTFGVRQGKDGPVFAVADVMALHDASEPASARASHSAFGTGRALILTRTATEHLVATIFPDLPFVFLKTVLRNPQDTPRVMHEVRMPELRLDLGVAADDVKALGTAGLTPPDGHSGSYAFLALADPASRRGVVAGWLTHDRGSGVLFSSVRDGAVCLDARIDYGKLRIPQGGSVESETLVVGFFDDARLGLEAYADLVARHYNIKLNPQLDGYCTWYSSPHGGASDEGHVAELAEFAARELKPYGFDFVQIDDKWQEGKRRNGPAKVFCKHNPEGPYPNGMRSPADRMSAVGIEPGIWFMPFAGDHEDPFFADRQHWFVKRPDGSPYSARWGGTSMDMTHPEAQAYLADVAKTLASDWGYTYFKMDGLWVGTATQLLYVNNAYKPDDIGDAVFHNPDKTNVEAYRDGLKLVREAAGDDVFFLGCCVSQNMRSFGASFGLVDAMRIGPDNGSSWGGLVRGPWHGTNRYFLHGRVWYNDPDPVYVRPSTPIEHARLICSWVGLTGQLTVISEWLPGLPPERLDIFKRILPNHGLKPRPVDLFEQNTARIWLLTDDHTGTRRDLVGMFNWDADQPCDVSETPERIGLPKADEYVAFDYWANRFVPPFRRHVPGVVAPGSCRVLSVRPASLHPQIISTSRHVTQGIVDLVKEEWDADRHTLRGVSKLVGSDPYEARIIVPVGEQSWQLADVAVSAEDRTAGVAVEFEQKGPKVRVTLRSPASRSVTWSASFKKAEVAVPAPTKPTGLEAESDYTSVLLSWDDVGEETYRVVRDDGTATETPANRFADLNVGRGKTYTYVVSSIGWDGMESERATVEVSTPKEIVRPPTPPLPDLHISDLKTVRAATGWGKIHRDKSCGGRTLTIEGQSYEKGMGVHADSVLVYAIPAGARRFVAVAGLDDEEKTDPRASIVLEVYGDVKEMGEPPDLLAKSPPLCDRTVRGWAFDLALSDRLKELRLVVTDAGDGIACDHADWANAGFVLRNDGK